jgi:hypothetical protein
VTAEVVAAALDDLQARRGGDEGEGRAELVDRPERIARAVDEQRRDAEPREVGRARRRGTCGRAQRIGQQEQRVRDRRVLGGQDARWRPP